MSLTPAAVRAARPAPVVPGQLDLFGDPGPAPDAPAACAQPDTCTDHDPCPPCLADAHAAGLTLTTDPEGITR